MKLGKKAYLYMFLTFLLTFLLKCLMYCKTTNISLISDHIGQLALPSYLGGRDWSSLISESSYYGWGYNWIFSVVFRLTNNPYAIYGGIIIWNTIMISMTSMLIYYIQTKYIARKYFFNTIVSVFICLQASVSMSTECSVFMCIWISIFILCCLHQNNSKTKFCIFSLVLGIWSCYTLTLHERNFTLIFSYGVAYVILWLWKKVRIFSLIPFIVSFIGTYILEVSIKNNVIDLFWSEKNALGNLKNTSIINGNQFWFFEDFIRSACIMLETLWANLYTLASHTYGLILFTIVLLFYWTGKSMRRDSLKSKRINKEEQIAQTITVFSLSASFVIIMGLMVQWGRGVANDNYYSYKGYTYYRYYLPYIWPSIACTLHFLPHFTKKAYVAVLSIYGTLALYINVFVLTKLEMAQALSSRDIKINNAFLSFANIIGEGESAGKTTFICIFAMLLICFFKSKHAADIMLALGILITVGGSIPFSEFRFPEIICTNGGGIYGLYEKMPEDKLPEEIYASSNAYTLQFMLNDYKVIQGIPDKSETEAVVYAASSNVLLDGYQLYKIDNNEYIYVLGDRLIEIFDASGLSKISN